VRLTRTSVPPFLYRLHEQFLPPLPTPFSRRRAASPAQSRLSRRSRGTSSASGSGSRSPGGWQPRFTPQLSPVPRTTQHHRDTELAVFPSDPPARLLSRPRTNTTERPETPRLHGTFGRNSSARLQDVVSIHALC